MKKSIILVLIIIFSVIVFSYFYKASKPVTSTPSVIAPTPTKYVPAPIPAQTCKVDCKG